MFFHTSEFCWVLPALSLSFFLPLLLALNMLYFWRSSITFLPIRQMDQYIGRGNLFKQSLILIKAWCFYESRLLGSHCNLMSTYALEILVLYIINIFHCSLSGPLAVSSGSWFQLIYPCYWIFFSDHIYCCIYRSCISFWTTIALWIGTNTVLVCMVQLT